MRATKNRWLGSFASALLGGTLVAQPSAQTSATVPSVTNTTVAQDRVLRNVVFEIDMSAEIAAGRFDPARDHVGVRGASPPLSWGETKQAESVGNARYRIALTFNRPRVGTQPLQYKFKTERDNAGANQGWEEGRNRVVALNEPTQSVARMFNSPPEPLAIERTGRIDRIAPHPSKYVEPREVQVWLPPGYEDNNILRYPVLYLHDGQAVFDAAMAGAEWRFDETAQTLVGERRVAPFIIVAVSNTARRMDEYTPTAMTLPAERTGTGRSERAGGGAQRYADYLIREVKPMIDDRYRTKRDVANTAVGGASLGGLVSLWLALHRSDVFGAALVVSPSVWWDDQFLLRDVTKASANEKQRPRLWLDMGTEEGREAIPAVRKLRNALIERGWRDDNLHYHEATDATHDEASWALRVPAMLQFLYGKK
jgi:predicted alpha/beta superfamily hydrolase